MAVTTAKIFFFINNKLINIAHTHVHTRTILEASRERDDLSSEFSFTDSSSVDVRCVVGSSHMYLYVRTYIHTCTHDCTFLFQARSTGMADTS